MPPEGDASGGVGGSNSSDFVRKLYGMLQDPQYRDIVRWTEDGYSFVVLENNRFTSSILPKHFKHSNFASFVRQLNKYDFHKIKHNEEDGPSPYGSNSWQFRHPYFTKHDKSKLDSIKRKAPAARKGVSGPDDAVQASQQVALLVEQLSATQVQVQALLEHVSQLSSTNRAMVDEILFLQKNVRITHQVNGEVLNHLSNLDERRRNSRHSAHSSHSGQSTTFHNGTLGVLPDGNDEPSIELRRARDVHSTFDRDAPAERPFQRMSVGYQANSPPDSAASSAINMFPPNSAVLPQQVLGNFIDDPRHLVYPAGPNVGIDPFHPDHVNSLPFPISQGSQPPEMNSQMVPREKKKDESLWGARKPRIFLVEDDKTCSRIGAKFLSQIECMVEIAKDGEEAVNKINQEPKRFDLIFMDIIMPNVDGVSATVYIRGVSPDVPIIAMTSNIRADEIAHYYQFGMNDTLAKPFTKEGMIKVVKKYCRHLLKNPIAVDIEPPMTGLNVQVPQYDNVPTPVNGTSMKFESNTPMHSPSTSGSWHSPSQQLAHASPNLDAGYIATAGGPMGVSAPQMVMTPGGSFAPQMGTTQPQMGTPQLGTPQLSRMPGEMGGGEPTAKRQRMFMTPAGPPYRQ